MPTCGDCEHYMFYITTGQSDGYCKVIVGDRRGQPGKKVRFSTDANKCSKFEQLEYKVTDSQQIPYEQHLRVYGDFDPLKIDEKGV